MSWLFGRNWRFGYILLLGGKKIIVRGSQGPETCSRSRKQTNKKIEEIRGVTETHASKHRWWLNELN